jgi:hypothetical protein
MGRPLKPEQIEKLKTIDFDRFAATLFNETHRAQFHVDIFEGLTKVDPFILHYTPMFFRFTIWAHEYAAMMYATKLFDPHEDSFTVPKFLEMAKMRAAEFYIGGGSLASGEGGERTNLAIARAQTDDIFTDEINTASKSQCP